MDKEITENEIPVGWELVSLLPSEISAMCDAADIGDIENAEIIIEDAYSRLFGESVN